MATPWSDVIGLVSVYNGHDEDGFPEIVESDPTDVFANKKSIRSQEFYLAKQNGIELTYMFDVRTIDYDGQTIVLFNGVRHEVERTYEKGEFVELICKKRSDEHES